MVLSPSSSFPRWSLGDVIKCFVVWMIVLIICWLVVGFPVVALLVINGWLMVIGFQLELPMSAIAMVVGCVMAFKVGILVITAVFLTAWGIPPHQIPGLLWLNPKINRV